MKIHAWKGIIYTLVCGLQHRLYSLNYIKAGFSMQVTQDCMSRHSRLRAWLRISLVV